MDLSQLYFSKQFFITSLFPAPSTFSHWRNTELKDKKHLFTHPQLLLTIKNNNHSQLVLLGTIIDPSQPSHSNEDILQRLLTLSHSFLDIEKALYSLGGRWVLIITSADRSRIYHDAAGLKPVFYCHDKNNLAVIASQPALIEKLGYTKRNEKLIEQFEKYRNSKSWPLGLIPYDNVKQLIPNHYLNVLEMNSVRYWPNEEIIVETTRQAAKKISAILSGTIAALSQRNPCILSLTGGYDSRMLLSCAKNINSKLDYFTIKSDFTPNYDIDIPKQLAKKHQLQHHFATRDLAPKDNKKIVEILSKNVGGMYYDRSMANITAFAKIIQSKTHLPGSVSEIGRCYYYPYGNRLSRLSGKSIARYAGFKNNPHAITPFQNWLSSVPKRSTYHILDLLYWEHRLGVWASCGLTYREGLIEQIPPMNNREFMDLCLAVPTKDRLPPHQLSQAVIAFNDTSLLKIRFNNDNSNAKSLYYRFPLLRRLKDRLVK